MHIAIIGGDRRMLYAAKAFADSGAVESVSCFDTADMPDGINNADIVEAIKRADAIVLPIRPIDGDRISAPYSDTVLKLCDLRDFFGARPVFSGSGELIRGYVGGKVYDYTAREEFSVYNAALTAEGALGLIADGYEGSIFGSRILVTGYGRIGRILSGYLKKLGADVTVAARRPEQRAWAALEGMNTCDYSNLELKSYDIIINTVPATVLTADLVDTVSKDSIIIDLASAPGGVDKDRAGERGIKCIHALALPGRTAPAAAGRIIKDTICNIIKEENGGKDNFGLCDDRLLLHL